MTTASALVGMAESFETLAIALFGVGLFAAIYHPVGTPMVVDAAPPASCNLPSVEKPTHSTNGWCPRSG